MRLSQLTEAELSETIGRAQEIASLNPEAPAVAGEYEAYLHAAEEMGVPREAMLQALRERQLLSSEDLEVGQSVFAPSADGFWYVAKILSLSDHTARVEFVDGGEHTCARADVRPLTLIPGRKLQGDVKDWGWYNCIVVRHDPEKNRVEVLHDDWAPAKEWLPVRKLRLTREHVHPRSRAEKAADTARATLTRWVLAAGGAGIALGILLDRLLPALFPFLR